MEVAEAETLKGGGAWGGVPLPTWDEVWGGTMPLSSKCFIIFNENDAFCAFYTLLCFLMTVTGDSRPAFPLNPPLIKLSIL